MVIFVNRCYFRDLYNQYDNFLGINYFTGHTFKEAPKTNFVFTPPTSDMLDNASLQKNYTSAACDVYDI